MSDRERLEAKLAELEAQQKAALASEQQHRAAADNHRLAAHQAEGGIRVVRDLLATLDLGGEQPEKSAEKKRK